MQQVLLVKLCNAMVQMQIATAQAARGLHGYKHNDNMSRQCVPERQLEQHAWQQSYFTAGKRCNRHQ